MSWFNLNDSLNNIKGQITNFANDVLADETELKEARAKIKELEDLCAAQQAEIENIRIGNKDLADSSGTVTTDVWSWSSTNNQEDELKRKIQELQEEKKDLENNLLQLDLDCQQSIDKLVTLKDNLQRDYNDLEEKYDRLKDEREQADSRFTKLENQLRQLKSENAALKKQNNEPNIDSPHQQLDDLISVQKALKEENNQLDEYLTRAKNEIKALQITNASLKKENSELQQQQQNFEKLTQQLQKEKNDLHKSYINILASSMKKYVDGNVSTDLQEICMDPNVKEYTTQVESVLKLLLDFKLKTESLEKELYNLREEKSKTVAEKNHEIEKLLKNSEILSQEVISKTQTIKEYETECSELMKNNDLLISELERYKNSSSLETISESNEDNMVLLETQLEYANKKINDLEATIAERNKNCEIILEKYNALEEEHQALLSKYSRIETLFEALNAEKEELRASNENNEYKCTELNVLQDSLNEDIIKCKKTCADLTVINKNLETTNKDYETKVQVLEKGIEELHMKLLKEEEMCSQLQKEKTGLIEKLQSFKMAETSLKLHFNNELQTVFESKQETENKLAAVSVELAHYQDTLKERNATLEEIQLENKQLLDKNMVLLDQLKITEESYNALKERFDNCKVVQSNKQETLAISETKSLSYEGDSSDNNNSIDDTKILAMQSQLNDLINLVNNKQQENIMYHTEIQRLNQVVFAEIERNKQIQEELQQKNEAIEKLTDQNSFLQGKCEVLTNNLLQCQLNEKELERLRAHLVEIEDSYTQELLQADRKNMELQAKMNEIEEREKNSSTLYTSVSIRANQQVEALQNQIQMLTSQRDDLRKQLSDAEDENNKQAAALTNLNFVLQQFQRDREDGIRQETERISRQVKVEKQLQQKLNEEIESLKLQLEESRQGLQAASRLGDQLEFAKKQNIALKEEASKLKEQLKNSEAKHKEFINQMDGRVDKILIKNLIIGLITANNNLNKDQYQILKIIATVLDFNQTEHEKVNLNKIQQTSWFDTLLQPQISTNNVGSQPNTTGQSLSEAFVRFLENESKPKIIPKLLDATTKTDSVNDGNSSTSRRQSPIVLNEVVLPTFSDFGQTRNSSSILKDVLKDNS